MTSGQIVTLIVGIVCGLFGGIFTRWRAAAKLAKERQDTINAMHDEAKRINDNADKVASMSDDAVNKRLHDDYKRK